MHPLVFEAERAFLRREAAAGADMAVLEIPLLLETGGERRVDAVIVVQRAGRGSACPRACSGPA